MTVPADRSRFERFRAFVGERLGLAFDDGRLDFLAEVMRKRAAAAGIADVEVWLQRLLFASDPRPELRALAAELTVGETYFFRYFDHFRAFAERVLPERTAARPRPRRLRILSAGCASGEEPYSLAILVRERLPELLEAGEVSIEGFDLNPEALARAAQARYSPWALRETPPEWRERWFRASGREFALDERVRDSVRLEERNLAAEDPAFWLEGVYDVIFCRNVVMYLLPEVGRRVVARLERALAPGGCLFLGHAETLRGLSQGFHLCHTHDVFYYQRKAGVPPATAPASEPLVADSPAACLAPAIEAGASWLEAIQQATRRIAALAEVKAVPGRAPGWPRDPAPQARDLTPARDLWKQERFGAAMDELRTLSPDAQADPDARLLRAALLTNTGRLADAERECRALLELDELNAGAQYLMALCREHAGDAASALEHDRTAVYLDAGFAMPHLHMGFAAKRAGDVETARREFDRARALLPCEDSSRILLFGGGFTREALIELCAAELRACGGTT